MEAIKLITAEIWIKILKTAQKFQTLKLTILAGSIYMYIYIYINVPQFRKNPRQYLDPDRVYILLLGVFFAPALKSFGGNDALLRTSILDTKDYFFLKKTVRVEFQEYFNLCGSVNGFQQIFQPLKRWCQYINTFKNFYKFQLQLSKLTLRVETFDSFYVWYEKFQSLNIYIYKRDSIFI